MLFYAYFSASRKRNIRRSQNGTKSTGEVIFGRKAARWTWSARQEIREVLTRVGARPLPRGPPVGSPVAIFCYMKSFVKEKNHKQPFGTRLRRHEAEPWRNQSSAPAELFCRGHFPPRGGNHRHRHHQCSSHREREISINIFHQHHLISKP